LFALLQGQGSLILRRYHFKSG